MRRIALIIVALTVAACGTVGTQQPKNQLCPSGGISTSPGAPCH